MSKIIVTGGAGFIGSHIVDKFIYAGNSVLILDNLSSGSKANLNPDAEFIECDIRSDVARQAVADFAPDVLVHAAAQISVSESMKDPHYDSEVNICGLVNLLQASLSGTAKKPYVVFISTGGAIYGEQDIYPAPETHPTRPESFYGLAKKVGELYLDLWKRSYGLDYAVLRLSNVYGPRQNPHGEAGVVAIFTTLLLEGKAPVIFGDGDQTRDYIYVGDVVGAVFAAVQSGASGIFNVGTGKETSVNQLTKDLIKDFNAGVEPEYKEARPGEQRRSVIDASNAKSKLGWEPAVSLTEGLSQTAEWFRSQRGS